MNCEPFTSNIRLLFNHFIKQMNWPRYNTFIFTRFDDSCWKTFFICIVFVAFHSKCFSWSSLSISKNRRVISLFNLRSETAYLRLQLALLDWAHRNQQKFTLSLLQYRTQYRTCGFCSILNDHYKRYKNQFNLDYYYFTRRLSWSMFSFSKEFPA